MTRETTLDEVARTLRAGRTHLPHRLAVVARETGEAIEALHAALAGKPHPRLLAGVASPRPEADPELVAQGNLRKLAGLWVQGVGFDWARLPGQSRLRRVPLPTYPFAREVFPWTAPPPGGKTDSLHPFLDANVSSLSGVRFVKRLDANAFYFRDHLVAGRPLLPGVAQLEMIRAAASLATDGAPVVRGLRQVVWPRPITPEAGSCAVTLRRENQRLLAAVGEPVCCQAEVVLEAFPPPARLDLEACRASCPRAVSADEFYAGFAAGGQVYGPAFRGVEEIRVGENETLAAVRVPDGFPARFEEFELHPALLDGALQSVSPLAPGGAGLVPFGIGEVQLHRKPPVRCVARATRLGPPGEAGLRFRVELADERGEICVLLNEISFRRGAAPPAPSETLLYQPAWEPAPPADGAKTAPALLLYASGADWALRLGGSVAAAVPVSGSAATDAQAAAALLDQNPGSRLVFQWNGATEVETLTRALHLARALSKRERGASARIITVGPESDLALPALAALARTLRLEHPGLDWRVVLLGPDATDADADATIIAEELRAPEVPSQFILRAGGLRQARVWRPAALSKPEQSFEPGETWWLTGGLGGVGRHLAAWLARRGARRIALSGRSRPSAQIDERLAALRASGAEVLYVEADAADQARMKRALDEIHRCFGPVHGVAHLAGTTNDLPIRQKDLASAEAVLRAKMDGARILDELTAAEPLGAFVLFSSLSAVLGNPGHCDYGAANAFLDAFADWRSAQVRLGLRQGRSLSLNWPAWRDGGFRLKESARHLMEQMGGLRPLPTETGLEILGAALQSNQTGQLAVLYGIAPKLRALLTRPAPAAPEPARTEPAGLDSGGRRLLADLQQLLGGLLRLRTDQLGPDVELDSLGFDSVAVAEFAVALNRRYNIELSPVSFFEFTTLGRMARHLEQAHGLGSRPNTAAPAEPARPPAISFVEPPPPPAVRADAIAVIGMAGVFPQSANLDVFFDRLLAGEDLITEIPPERFDWRAIYGDPRDPAKTPCKWGGFVPDADKFDAAFFQISRREAELMDPQQRMFLQTVWHAVENAGYAAGSLRGSGTAVFVANQNHDYAELLQHLSDPFVGTGTVGTILPNRVSYLMDWHGPSELVDTACSSGLVAVHRAVEALRHGEAEMAVAGAAHLLLSPRSFVVKGQMGIFSPEGRCKTFDRGADGMVTGEGVCALLLKPAARAVADGDHIHGLILGSAVNHGGRSKSLTAPNPAPQAALIARAMARADVSPETISYIEAHGTGTELGDPVEVEGLKRAFRQESERRGVLLPASFCGLGSVKTNIGHLEAAAGLAGLIKTLLAMRHEALPATLHLRELNPLLDLDGGPFHVIRQRTAWPREEGRPRRAGVSSFGFGGANAHVIVQEPPPPAPRSAPEAGPELVVLSARTQAALREGGARLAEWLGSRGGGVSLADLAWTLQTGRDAMPVRFAAVVNDTKELRRLLEAFSRDGRVPDVGGELGEMARRWVSGGEPDWKARLPGGDRRRTPLPGYAFAQERHWVAKKDSSVPVPASVSAVTAFLVPRWRPSDPAEDRPAPERAIVLILEADDGLAGGFPQTVVRFVEPEDARRQAREILKTLPESGAIIDLTDLQAGENPAPNYARLAFLQELVGARHRGGLVYLHVTRNRVAHECGQPGLAGAWFAGYTRMLGAEYRRTTIRAVDVDDATELGPALARELRIGGLPGEVCHRRGRRFAPVWEPLDSGTIPAPKVDPEGVYVITGGTGDLGRLVAGRLADLGARKLALTCLHPLPPREEWGRPAGSDRRVAGLRTLLDRGVQLLVHAGPLTGVTPLKSFLDEARARGRIAGVVHAAGAALMENPAFFKKSLEHVRRVTEPKVEGLLALMEALSADDPDFCLLFSSASSAVAELGVGLSDYAAANYFLDAAAARAQALGRRAWRSVQWPNWRATAMGGKPSERYTKLGFAALETDRGLEMFEQMLGLPEAVVWPRATDPGAPPAPPARPSVSSAPPPSVSTEARERVGVEVRRIIAAELRLDPGELDGAADFGELGVDSIMIAEIVKRLEAWAKRPIEPAAILEHPTLDRLAAHLAESLGGTPPPETAAASGPVRAPKPAGSDHGAKIAVIGLACHLPRARDPDEFWRNLAGGRDCLREAPADRWDTARWYAAEGGPGRTISKWGGFIDDIQLFDPDYFKIAADEAVYVDPLARQILEASAQCLRHAGYEEKEWAGKKLGVFAGARMAGYSAGREAVPSRQSILGVGQNFIAARVSQFLDARGPSLVVDTACSSSLVSLHLACRSLLSGECEAALAGGVDILLDEKPYVMLSAAKALSPDGLCRAFDEKANGFVPGEGAAVFLLKRLDRALADGDRVLAVVEASAVNNDGRTMGITTPSMEAQTAVVREALEAGGTDPRSIGLIEAHGTGTMIGDPIELKGLTKVFRRWTDDSQFCAVGSVKSNVGHLLSAAGAASLLKVVLALQNRRIPPSLHCERPNPRFNFAQSPFYVARTLEDWAPRQGVRRAGVSSFGFGGTNAHVILTEAAAHVPGTYQPTRQPLAPAEFHRRRFWLDRETAPAAPAGPGGPAPLPPLLVLEETA